MFSLQLFGQEVLVGEQTWRFNNLDVTNFRNGDPIKQVRSNKEWINSLQKQEPAWSYYKNKKKNNKRYGKIYNWFAVIDDRGLAPEGWRITTIEDWENLSLNLGGIDSIGYKIKDGKKWSDNSIGSININLLPGGFRGMGFAESKFVEKGNTAYWWCLPSEFYIKWNMVEEYNEKSSSFIGLFKDEISIGIIIGSPEWINGAYVKCIKTEFQ
jgi:uncharacterized protein (TIGR02145 family)